MGYLFHRHHVLPLPGEAGQLFGPGNLFLMGKAATVLMASGSWRTYITRSELTDVALAPMPLLKRLKTELQAIADRP